MPPLPVWRAQARAQFSAPRALGAEERAALQRSLRGKVARSEEGRQGKAKSGQGKKGGKKKKKR